MVLYASQAEEREELASARGRTVLYRVGRSTLVCRSEGYAVLDHVERMIARSEALVASAGIIEVFHDWFEVVGYEPSIRSRMTPWALKTRDLHRGVHIGIGSRIVQMGVSMVRIASGAPVFVYTSAPSLDVAMARALQMRPSILPPR